MQHDDATPPPWLPEDSLSTFEAGAPAPGFRPGPEAPGDATATGSAETLAPPAANEGGAPQDLPGRHYRLIRIAGRGGSGDVWEAEQASLQRVVALKRVRDAVVGDEGAREHAIRECRQEALAAAALDHPNIVPVHELVEEPDGGLAFSMKLVRGDPWEKLLVEDRALLHPDEYRTKHLGILLDVAQAVAFAHSRGIVHRDIKPTQVMTGPFGETLLMDWGLALRTAAQGADDQPLALEIPTTTEARSPAGTPACMAPEQTRDTAEGIGPWTDVFLLGACLHRVLSGRYLYAGKTVRECLRRAAECDFEPLTAGDAPGDLLELLRDSLRADPAGRIRDAGEFRARLEAHLSGAGRRRESEALADEARAALNAAQPPTYATLDEALSLAARARAAWSGNARAELLREDAATQYARLALAHGDLELAAIHAASLRDEPERARLLSAIGRRRAARRGARVAVAALGILVLAGSLFYNQRLATARAAEEKARADAEQQRDAAQASLAIASAQAEGASDLIDFVLGALRDALRDELTPESGVRADDADRIAEAIARRVAAPVAEHYQRTDATNWPEALVAAHTNRMIESAWLLLELRGVEEAEQVANTALAMRRATFGDEHPSLASPLLAASGAALQRDDIALAVALAEQAFQLFDPAKAPSPTAVAFAHIIRANAYRRAGQLEDARLDYEQAMELMAGDPGAGADNLAAGLNSLASQYAAEGRHEEAIAAAGRALAIGGPDRQAQALWLRGASRARLSHPGAVPDLEQALDLSVRHFGPSHSGTMAIMSLLGDARAAQGDHPGAAQVLRQLLDARERAHGRLDEQTIIAASQLSNVLVAARDFEAALPVMQRIVADGEQLWPAEDPRLPSLRVAILRIGGEAARALDAKGDRAAAEDAMRVALAGAYHHPQAYGHIKPARLDVAWMLARTGRAEEARPLLEALAAEDIPAALLPRLHAAMQAAGMDIPPPP